MFQREFESPGAYTSYQLYFTSNGMQSPRTLERHFLYFLSICAVDSLQICSQNSHGFVIEEIMNVKCCQISYSQSVSVNDKVNGDHQLVAATHPHVVRKNVFWPCIDLDL